MAPHPAARTLQALHGLLCTDLAIFEITYHGVQLIELHLVNVHVTEEIACEGLELLGGFDQPVQNGMRVHLKHAGRGANAQAFRQARQHVDDQLHRQAFAMQERTVRLQKVSVTRATVKLTPQATAGMAVGAQVA